MSASVEFLQSPRISPALPCYGYKSLEADRSPVTTRLKTFYLPLRLCQFVPDYPSTKVPLVRPITDRRVRFALIPAVFGIDGSSPPHVRSWGYKHVGFPDSKGGPSKRRRSNMMKRNDESRCDT